MLLSTSHGSSLYVESFLKMVLSVPSLPFPASCPRPSQVQKLLETGSAEFELAAVDSFVAFSHIEEDTPGYHRRYDFFIRSPCFLLVSFPINGFACSKFSQLCHYASKDPAERKALRVAGLKGLR